jgi:hypothetical protein
MVVQPSRPHHPEADRRMEPVMSLCQYVQMQGEEEGGSLQV